MNYSVVMDFDGTITMDEVSVAILERFADGDWRSLEKDLYAGKITLIECMRRQFGMLRCSRRELAGYVKETTVIRTGLDAFVSYCLSKEIPVTICSAGMDFYIAVALSGFPWYRSIYVCVPKARFTKNGVRLVFPKSTDGQDFKTSFVVNEQSKGKRVIYIGDGASDQGAVRVAHTVFARGRLHEYCLRDAISCYSFDEFHQVIKTIDGMLITSSSN